MITINIFNQYKLPSFFTPYLLEINFLHFLNDASTVLSCTNKTRDDLKKIIKKHYHNYWNTIINPNQNNIYDYIQRKWKYIYFNTDVNTPEFIRQNRNDLLELISKNK